MRLTKLVIYNFSLLIILFLIAEVVCKVTSPNYKYYERSYAQKFNQKAIYTLDTNWVKKDPDLGWVCRQKQDLKFYKAAFFDVDYQINKQGFRNAVDFDSLSFNSKKRILLLGDSFLFGLFLANNETITARLQENLGDEYEVINMAVPGWGIDQMYQAYVKYSEKISPSQVILFYIDDDIFRTIEAFYWGAGTKTAYTLYNDQLIERGEYHGKLNAIENFFIFSSQIINRLYKIKCSRKALAISEAILQKMSTAEHKVNRNLTAIRFPRIEQIGNLALHAYDLAPFFTQVKCVFADVEETLITFPKQQVSKFYISGDDHPSAAGASFIAGFLAKSIQEK